MMVNGIVMNYGNEIQIFYTPILEFKFENTYEDLFCQKTRHCNGRF